MALCRVCNVGSLKLLSVLSKHKIVTTSRVGYAKKGGNTFLLVTVAAFMQMPVFTVRLRSTVSLTNCGLLLLRFRPFVIHAFDRQTESV